MEVVNLLPQRQLHRPLLCAALLGAAFSVACQSPTTSSAAATITFDFARGAENWTPIFSNYIAGQDHLYEFEARHAPLPAPLDTSRGGLFISGIDYGTLQMFWKRRVTGLRPGRSYDVVFTTQFATQMGRSVFGDVWAIGGSSPIEPAPVLTGTTYRMNIALSDAAVTLGLAHKEPALTPDWELKELRSEPGRLKATVAADGSLWLFIGTSSVCMCKLGFYFTRVIAELTPM